MTTDDSPALGGRSDDNAPMISSVLTHVIVSARGAYTVGNLDALIELMEPSQKLLFKHRIIQQAFDIVLPVITQMPDTQRNYPELLDVVDSVQEWLARPDDELLEPLHPLLYDNDFV